MLTIVTPSVFIISLFRNHCLKFYFWKLCILVIVSFFVIFIKSRLGSLMKLIFCYIYVKRILCILVCSIW
ncbi:hypothetical protein HanIR_Chr05g0244611 [Helianthus annuus]|nr:hypothetical protein HanIR_Chr05g0244611 [Helianthus annuus]